MCCHHCCHHSMFPPLVFMFMSCTRRCFWRHDCCGDHDDTLNHYQHRCPLLSIVINMISVSYVWPPHPDLPMFYLLHSQPVRPQLTKFGTQSISGQSKQFKTFVLPQPQDYATEGATHETLEASWRVGGPATMHPHHVCRHFCEFRTPLKSEFKAHILPMELFTGVGGSQYLAGSCSRHSSSWLRASSLSLWCWLGL